MDPQPRQPAPDYFPANLVMIFVNMLWIFVALWAVFGLEVVILLAVAINHGITVIDHRRKSRQ